MSTFATLAEINTEIGVVQAKITAIVSAMGSATSTGSDESLTLGPMTIKVASGSAERTSQLKELRAYLNDLIELRDNFPTEYVDYLHDDIDVFGVDSTEYSE